MLQKVSIRKDNAERLYLSSHTTKKSLSELDDTTNDAQDTNLKREEMKNSLLDTNDDDEVKPKTSTSKEFPLIEYDVPVYFCETCSASFETKTALYNHEKRHKL